MPRPETKQSCVFGKIPDWDRDCGVWSGPDQVPIGPGPNFPNTSHLHMYCAVHWSRRPSSMCQPHPLLHSSPGLHPCCFFVGTHLGHVLHTSSHVSPCHPSQVWSCPCIHYRMFHRATHPGRLKRRHAIGTCKDGEISTRKDDENGYPCSKTLPTSSPHPLAYLLIHPDHTASHVYIFGVPLSPVVRPSPCPNS